MVPLKESISSLEEASASTEEMLLEEGAEGGLQGVRTMGAQDWRQERVPQAQRPMGWFVCLHCKCLLGTGDRGGGPG